MKPRAKNVQCWACCGSADPKVSARPSRDPNGCRTLYINHRNASPIAGHATRTPRQPTHGRLLYLDQGAVQPSLEHTAASKGAHRCSHERGGTQGHPASSAQAPEVGAKRRRSSAHCRPVALRPHCSPLLPLLSRCRRCSPAPAAFLKPGSAWWKQPKPGNMDDISSVQQLVDALEKHKHRLVVVEVGGPVCGWLAGWLAGCRVRIHSP